MKVKVSAHITRSSQEVWRIKIMDQETSARFLEVEMTDAEMAQVLSGRYMSNLLAEARGLDKLGTLRRELVAAPAAESEAGE